MKTVYPAPGILDDITDRIEARKKLYVPRTNQNDDSMNVNWDSANKQVTVIHYQDSNNSQQLIADDTDGVYLWSEVNGTGKTIPTAVTRGGTGATDAENARINLELALKSGATTGIARQMEAASWVSGGSTTMEFTIPTNFNIGSLSTVKLTSLKIIPRGINGYIDNMAPTLTEMIGKSGFTVTATKINNYAFSVKIVKNSAMANCTNNTPATISYTYTATVT